MNTGQPCWFSWALEAGDSMLSGSFSSIEEGCHLLDFPAAVRH